MLAEARQALPQLKAAAVAPAGEGGVFRVVSRRFALFPQPQRDEAETAAWWLDYYDTLAGQPEASLEAAMQAWVRRHDAEFMPKPGQLLELSRETSTRAAEAATRAQEALKLADALAPVERPKPDAEAVRAMMAEFAQAMQGKADKWKPAKRPLPPAPTGWTDEGGITPELRAIEDLELADEEPDTITATQREREQQGEAA